MPTFSKQTASWNRRALNGAGTAAFLSIIVLAYFFMTSNLVRFVLLPLIVVSIAGALGGVAFALTDPLRRHGGWRRTAANMMSGMMYLMIVFAAFVAVLDVPSR